jgi:hypothetical protein
MVLTSKPGIYALACYNGLWIVQSPDTTLSSHLLGTRIESIGFFKDNIFVLGIAYNLVIFDSQIN